MSTFVLLCMDISSRLVDTFSWWPIEIDCRLMQVILQGVMSGIEQAFLAIVCRVPAQTGNSFAWPRPSDWPVMALN